MSTFTEKEIERLRGQPLGRLATVGRDGSPHVVPVGFRLGPEDETIEVGGHALKGSKKWRDLEANPRVAFVIDDLKRVDPLTPRGLEVRGRAELHEEGGERFGEGWGAAWIRILPRRILAWGIEGPAFSAGPGRRALARSAAESVTAELYLSLTGFSSESTLAHARAVHQTQLLKAVCVA